MQGEDIDKGLCLRVKIGGDPVHFVDVPFDDSMPSPPRFHIEPNAVVLADSAGIRGLHEEAGPMTVSYTFKGLERKGEDEEEAKEITGEVEPPEEGGKEQTFANPDFECVSHLRTASSDAARP